MGTVETEITKDRVLLPLRFCCSCTPTVVASSTQASSTEWSVDPQVRR